MLALPSNTEVNKQLPKAAIYRSFDSRSLPRERFDNDISKIFIVNELSPATLHIAEGNLIKSIFVLNVLLKRKDYDVRNILALSKLIPQKMLFAIQKDEMMQLAVIHTQLITSDWKQFEEFKLQLSGLNFDSIWESIVKQVGNIQLEDNRTLIEQISANTERRKVVKQIEMLEKRCRAEKQTHKKYEQHQQIIELKKLLK